MPNDPNSSPASLFAAPGAPGAKAKRRTGSRAKLAQRFFEDTYAAWEQQGESVLARAAFHDPMGFANMVARLMPQKIEVSTPTDGMSDERLAEMLDFAERMAALRGDAATVVLAHENPGSLIPVLGRGGGPFGDLPAREGSPSDTIRSAPAAGDPDTTVATDNPLDLTPDSPVGVSASAPSAALPYPVGRPFPEPGHVAEARNKRAIAEAEEEIDPSSLF